LSIEDAIENLHQDYGIGSASHKDAINPSITAMSIIVGYLLLETKRGERRRRD